MSREEEADQTSYRVVVNHEEQYSIWPAERENALGWNDAGFTGTNEACLAYIKKVWTDMRPLSLRGSPYRRTYSSWGTLSQSIAW